MLKRKNFEVLESLALMHIYSDLNGMFMNNQAPNEKKKKKKKIMYFLFEKKMNRIISRKN